MVRACRKCLGSALECKTARNMWGAAGEIVVVEEVPAYVCVHCGARYFTPEVDRALVNAWYAAPDAVLRADRVHFKSLVQQN